MSKVDVTLLEVPLLKALIQLKGKESGREFARKLKISPRYWELLYYGNRPIGITALKAIAKTFPELDGYVLAFLRDTQPPTVITIEEAQPILEISLGKTLSSSKVKNKHNVKCSVCGHITGCKHINSQNGSH